MPTNRDTYKYHFKKAHKIVHTGITNDLDRREAEHKNKPAWENGHITQIGHRPTRERALAWERAQQRLGKPVKKK